MFLQASSNMLREGLSLEMASAETRRHKPRDQHKDYSQEQLTGRRLIGAVNKKWRSFQMAQSTFNMK